MSKPTTVYLKDYTPLSYKIPEVYLSFSVHEDYIDVVSTFTAERVYERDETFILYGAKNLELTAVYINGDEFQDYTRTDEHLLLPSHEQVDVRIHTRIYPKKNLSLEGIYASGGILCSQNEPEGFRHITFFLDRPDNLSIYTVAIDANRTAFPYLLSNGNLISDEPLPDGRSRLIWHDPFPKPTYLFAFVAGDFGLVEDTFTTRSGRPVLIQFYVDHGNEEKCGHAIDSLKRSMEWDERIYNLEYDLDRYMVVAVDAFNFGAMENKGLNIFNSKYVLADPKTATDQDYINIENVIAHEYFHNWTGNRITCRDWFQLTLKEGLTVFRDQQYTGDVTSPTVKRIQEVRTLKTHQFLEDSGPNAHPIRPESYSEINNFYTSTVYRKGAEIIRMIHTLLGHDVFMKGIQHYVDTYDGQAVTTEDFISSMEYVSDVNFDVFKYWYSQAGTPKVTITAHYDDAKNEHVFTIKQDCRPTKESKNKHPFSIPIKFNLLTGDQSSLPELMVLEKTEDTLRVKGDPSAIPVWLHDFSAPVNLQYDYTFEQYASIVKYASNLFSRTEAMQALMVQGIQRALKGERELPTEISDAFAHIWTDTSITEYEKAEFLSIPSIQFLAEELNYYDFSALATARKTFIVALSKPFQEDLYTMVKGFHSITDSFSLDIAAIGKRQLHHACLYLLGHLSCEYTSLAYDIFKKSTTMSLQFPALKTLSLEATDEYKAALASFYDQWKDEFLVMNKWFMIQALEPRDTVLETVKHLEHDPAYNPKNPNMIRSLLYAFAVNLPYFHTAEGYRFIREKIVHVDQFNPSMASSLMETFSHYKKLPSSQRAIMDVELNNLKEETLSKNTSEILYNILDR